MPAGIQIDGISFDEIALVRRPEHAAVLGRIFTSWSLIEASVAGLLGVMMDAHPRAALAILATFRTNSSRVNAVKKVGKEMLEAPLQADFEKLMNDVLAYADERNKVAHNLWGVRNDEPEVVYRMPMTVISNLFVTLPHQVKPDVDALAESLKNQIKSLTVFDLEQIEQRGRDILNRVMTETTQKISHAPNGLSPRGAR